MTVAPRVACIGECMIELVEQPDGRLSRGFGGDTLNTAVYLARLGIDTAYVTALGDDPFSEAMLAGWRDEGVRTDLVLRVPGRLPGLYIVQTDAAGERRFSHWRDAAPARQLWHLPGTADIAAALPGFGTVYLSGITLSLYDDAGLAALDAALAAVRAAGGRIVFDTNFRARGWPDPARARRVYDAAIARADLLFASTEDLAGVYRTPDDSAAFALLRGRAAEIVVKHVGPACRVMLGEQTWHVPAPPVPRVVDTTAAGDSFAAAYLAARLAGRPPPEAAAAGHALAGLVVQHSGAIVPRALMGAQTASLVREPLA